LIAFVATARPDEARKFYGEILELPLVADDSFALVYDAHGVTLRVTKVARLKPAPRTVLGWRVMDIRAIAGELARRGVALDRFDGLNQDADGL